MSNYHSKAVNLLRMIKEMSKPTLSTGRRMWTSYNMRELTYSLGFALTEKNPEPKRLIQPTFEIIYEVPSAQSIEDIEERIVTRNEVVGILSVWHSDNGRMSMNEAMVDSVLRRTFNEIYSEVDGDYNAKRVKGRRKI
jgi:hypothetical protein